MNRHTWFARCLAGLAIILIGAGLLTAENIDPDEDGSQYAYGENVGWLNFEPAQGQGVHVNIYQLTGFVWAENIGWINLWPSNYGGVFNNGLGKLTGYAWGENVGWINFSPPYGGVAIDAQGNFDGWAWGENIGWIHFHADLPVAYKVRACVVDMEDIALFASQWLEYGDVRSNLDRLNGVDMADFAIFASHWLYFCPDAWPL